MSLPTRRTRRLVPLLAAALALAVPAVTGGPVQAEDPPWEEVASGLDNPRQLSFTGGALYVAEAGVGGSGPCLTGPEGDEVCYGATGAITKVWGHDQARVVEGLPSIAGAGGFAALGPADVRVRNHRFTVTIGLGADPAVRQDLPRLGRRLMGTITTGELWDDDFRVVANLAGFEARHDKDGLGPDSNPTGLIPRRGGWVATDSGANTLMRVNEDGDMRALAVFESPGDDIQPVPTSVAVGPGGAFFVSELTGFPFVKGLARIHRVRGGMPPTVYAEGLTNVTDLAWHDDELYAVQIADDGLLAAGPEGPMGSLVRVDRHGDHEMVAGPFPAPYGVAFHGDWAYVTTCSVCPDGGSVVRVEIDD